MFAPRSLHAEVLAALLSVLVKLLLQKRTERQ